MASAVVTNIQGYSIHDGPGIRSVVFLKYCPLRCQWCANPENLTWESQVGYLKNLCSGCGRCTSACPRGAMMDGVIDRQKCDNCGLCVEACYYDALVRYGTEMTSEAVFKKVRRDKMFYDSSGGGVTLSGGEPLIHEEFAQELCTMCQADGITTCIETCGFVKQETFEAMLPVVDQFYFDLKVMDTEKHKLYTGVNNGLILDNARYLVQQNAAVLFRQPLIAGVNDSSEDICDTAAFIKSLGDGNTPLQLMPYHRLGQAKYDALQLPYQMGNCPIMTAEAVEAVRAQYLGLGILCTISK